MPYRRVSANLSELLVDAPIIILDADASAGATSITVKSILGVTTNNILLFRGVGNEYSEIIATHAVTAPSGNTVTLVAAGLVEAHPAGTEIYIIRYNQIRFFRAATEVDANSDDSTLSALAAAQNIDPTQTSVTYFDSAQTSGFYYYRFSDSVNSVNSLYSDPVPWAARQLRYGENEVGYALENVKKSLGFDWNNKVFSKEDAIDEVNKCLRFVEGKLRHWSRYFVTDAVLGQTSRGVYSYALSGLSTTIYDNETARSIRRIRLGGQDRDLIWKDTNQFRLLMNEAKLTTVRTQTVAGDTSLAVYNSYDFDSSGSVNIYTSNTADAITYTGITRSTTVGVFTGISATGSSAIGATHVVGTNVWQDEEEGEPLFFTVNAGVLFIWPLPNATFINLNLRIDYWTAATSVDQETDVLDLTRYDMVSSWLAWKAKARLRNNGKLDYTDGDYLMFAQQLKDHIRTEASGQRFKMKPAINEIRYRPVVTQDFDKS